jgi:hypothetical protein
MDSDLEAFSHYPADGSFGGWVGIPTPKVREEVAEELDFKAKGGIL